MIDLKINKTLNNDKFEEIKKSLLNYDLYNFVKVSQNSSNTIINRIVDLEAVHPILDINDLHRRIGPYRRCYILTHPLLPEEPLVILHCAFLSSIPCSINEIIDTESLSSQEDLSSTNFIVFYSISSPHKGLGHLGLGGAIISRSMKEVSSQHPHIHFSTLSPLPKFKEWIQRCLNSIVTSKDYSKDINPSFRETFSDHYLKVLQVHLGCQDIIQTITKLQKLLQSLDIEVKLHQTEYVCVTNVLKLLGVIYLYEVKNNNDAFDLVCNFHLKNGAMIWRINWPSDLSEKGRRSSYGVMVNYRFVVTFILKGYYINKIEEYKEQYKRKIINVSPEIMMFLLDSSS